ncbi:MAG: hypothetical protein ACTHMM_10110 [Agriterribacter sp.]
MAYANKYRIAILNPGVANMQDSETPFSVLIQERDYSGAETILKGTSEPATLAYFNEDEKKYPSIQGSQLDIAFLSENNFSLEEIITDDNFQYRVVICYGAFNGTAFEDRPIWFGFLVTDDCTEQAQDDPKEIRLRATDGLGLLKTQAIYGIEVYEKKTLLELIERCLSFTGLELDLLIECSVFEQSMFDRSWEQQSEPFSQCKVHTRSFLSDVNTYSDCYQVLESILTAFQCSLFQQNGRWHIQRKHDRWNQEMELGTVYTYPYTQSDGEASLFNYEVTIDQNERYAIGADMLKGYIGASKFSEIKYMYKLPDQIPRNANFMQGDFYSLASGANNVATRINYWTYKRPNGSNAAATPYRNRTYDATTRKEFEAYVVLPRENLGMNLENLRLVSERVEVSRGDKLSISGEYRTKNGYNSQTHVIMQVILYGDSGTVYSLRTTINNPAYESTFWQTGTGRVIEISFGSDNNSAEWMSFNIQSPGFPEGGNIEILLYNSTQGGSGNEAWFKNLTFDWQLFVNDSVSIKGEKDTLTKNGTFRNKTEQTITIGDAPKKIISGALFRATDDTQLTANWHRQGKNESERLIRINDICLHQSTHRLYTKLDGTFLGITYTLLDAKQIIGPANLFYFPKSPLKDKFYLPTNLTISLGANTFTATLQEFYDTTKDNGDPQSDSKAFQYIYE